MQKEAGECRKNIKVRNIKKEMKYNIVLGVIICWLYGSVACAQSRVSQPDGSGETTEKLYDEKLLRTITPVAPTAASLGRYGDHPVDISMGLVPIEIPLYEIVSGGLRVPIKLKYHSGGIKVKQEASWVGLGWDLDFGGYITRTVSGYPDEAENENVPDADLVRLEMDSLARNLEDNYTQFGKYDAWARAKCSDKSFRPDTYMYSINGYSGHFFLKNDSIVPVSYVPIKGILDMKGTKSEIVSPDGTVYMFNKSEKTRLSSSQIKQPDYVSTLYVKKIISANRTDTISYTYQDSGDYTSTTSMSYQGQSLVTKTMILVGRGENPFNFTTTGVFSQEKKIVPYSGVPVYVNTVKTVKPQEIYFRGGRIVFNLSERKDLTHISGSMPRKLDNIVLEKKEGVQYKVLKKIYFHYSYFNGNENESNATNLYRLCLDSVTEQGFANTEELVALRLVAKFEYNNKNNLPGKNSCSMDFWGYYNGAPNSNLIPRTDMSTYGWKDYVVGGADRTPNEECIKYGSLKSITYPTKGKTEFVWEINRINREKSLFKPFGGFYAASYKRLAVSPPETVYCRDASTWKPKPNEFEHPCYKSASFETYTKHDASLELTVRRKTIVNNTHNKYDSCSVYLGDKLLYKTGDSTYIVQKVPLEANQRYSLRLFANCNNMEAHCTLTYDAYNPEEDQDKYNRPFTGLRIKRLVQTDKDGKTLSVKEYEYTDTLGRSSGVITTTDQIETLRTAVDVNERKEGTSFYMTETDSKLVFSELQEGPKEYDYMYKTVREKVYGKDGVLKAYTSYDFSYVPDDYTAYNVPVVSRSHLRGKLLRKCEFDCSSAEPRLVRDTRNFYSEDQRISINLRGFVMNARYDIASTMVMLHYVTLGEKPNHPHDVYIPSNYTYTSDWQHLDSTVVVEYGVGSERMRSKTFYTYGSAVHLQPTETVAAVGDCRTVTRNAYAPDLNDSVSQRMKSANMLLYPVHEKTYSKEGSSGEVLAGGVQNKYTVDGNGNIVLSEVSEFLKDGSLCRLYSYKYNNGGRIVEETGRDNIPTAVHWDADLMQPLVVARGMTSANLERTVAGGYSPLTLYKKPQCTNAEVTAFTHSPLVGITSMTRPDGYTLRYTYDGLGRLIRTYDGNGHTINEYRYNYGKETR